MNCLNLAAIIHNAPPFLVNLALQTGAPQLKQNLDNLQAIADKWLNQSISSCEAAQAALADSPPLPRLRPKSMSAPRSAPRPMRFPTGLRPKQCNNDATVNGQLDAGKTTQSLKA